MSLTPASGLASHDLSAVNKIDFSDVLSAILHLESNLVGRIKVATGEERAFDTTHKWPEDALAPNTVTVAEDTFSASDPANGGNLVLATGHANRLRIGSLLMDIASGKREVFQVTAIVDAQTVTVTRGYGTTSAEIHQTDATFRIIGMPIQENKIAQVTDDIWSGDASANENFTQLFERVISIGDTVQILSKNGIYHGIKDKIAHEVAKRTIEMKDELADSIINGIKSSTSGSDSVYRTMSGLIEQLMTGGSLHDSTSEAFTEGVANDMVSAVLDQGGQPNTLALSSALVAAVHTWDQDRVRVSPDSTKTGRYISKWRTQRGVELDIVWDRFVPDDCAGVIDLSKMKILPLAGDEWHGEKMARTGRITVMQLSGQYTLEIRNKLNGHMLHSQLSVPT